MEYQHDIQRVRLHAVVAEISRQGWEMIWQRDDVLFRKRVVPPGVRLDWFERICRLTHLARPDYQRWWIAADGELRAARSDRAGRMLSETRRPLRRWSVMRRAIVRWLPIAVVLSSLLGCRGGASSPPKDQVVRQATTDLLTHVQQRQYAAVWDTLHPAQQVLLPREQLVACGERFGPAFEAFSIAEVTMEDVTPDAVGPTTATVVTVLFDLTPEFAQGSATPIDRRFRFVEVDGGWCWLLGTGELAVFKQGNCGLPWPGGGHAP